MLQTAVPRPGETPAPGRTERRTALLSDNRTATSVTGRRTMARSLPLDTGGFLVAPLTISYDRAVLDALLDDPDYGYAVQFLALDLHDRCADHNSLTFLRALLHSIAVRDAWHCSDNPKATVGVYGEFTCDSEGFMDGGALTLSVLLNGVGVCDTGIDALRDLPFSQARTVFDLLDSVATHLNQHIRQLTAMLCPPPAQSLALSVFPTDVVPGEANENPNLTNHERTRKAATDAAIAAAIEQAWPAVEDRWYAIHDELQEAAMRTVLNQ